MGLFSFIKKRKPEDVAPDRKPYTEAEMKTMYEELLNDPKKKRMLIAIVAAMVTFIIGYQVYNIIFITNYAK